MDNHGLGTGRYGPRWRLGRKLFHQHIGKNAIRDYSSAFEEESRMLVHRLHQKPDTSFDQICLSVTLRCQAPLILIPFFLHRAVTRIILGVTYDYRSVQSTSDPVKHRPYRLSSTKKSEAALKPGSNSGRASCIISSSIASSWPLPHQRHSSV
jgi:hypothetical protein